MKTNPIAMDAKPRWRVIRQDDNGQVFLVADDLDEAAATCLVAEFEARAHKQQYFAEPVDDRPRPT